LWTCYIVVTRKSKSESGSLLVLLLVLDVSLFQSHLYMDFYQTLKDSMPRGNCNIEIKLCFQFVVELSHSLAPKTHTPASSWISTMQLHCAVFLKNVESLSLASSGLLFLLWHATIHAWHKRTFSKSSTCRRPTGMFSKVDTCTVTITSLNLVWDQSFAVTTLPLCNSLPTFLRSTDTELGKFKRLMKMYLFRVAVTAAYKGRCLYNIV